MRAMRLGLPGSQMVDLILKQSQTAIHFDRVL